MVEREWLLAWIIAAGIIFVGVAGWLLSKIFEKEDVIVS